jgi:hypothetical protein
MTNPLRAPFIADVISPPADLFVAFNQVLTAPVRNFL